MTTFDRAPVAKLPDQMRPSDSERFGKYWLSRRIGEGGMATLYLGTAEGPDGFSKPCVVKRIRPVHSDKESFRRMLGQEARVAALLNHPNIVQVFDFGEVEGENYLTMEYVEGASLNHLLRLAREEGVPLGWASALTVGMALADALDYIHTGVELNGALTPLVHRDVSPSNILVSGRGAIKLTDFGIVKILHTPGVTASGVVKGKYGYMSPEQVKGQDLDGRSDIFALGAVLWEMLAGRPLFRRNDVAATIAAVLAGAVPPLAEAAPAVPNGLQEVLDRALASRRSDRYESARQLHDDLAALATADDVSEARRALALRASLIAQSGNESLSDVAYTGSHVLYGTREAFIADDAEGDTLSIWVAVVTATVVASVLLWIMLLR